MRMIHLLLPLAMATVVACGQEEATTGVFTVRDSAGIEIVHSVAPQWVKGTPWSVDPTPDLDLSGQDDSELFRLQSPRLLPDGRLVAFNGGRCEVRFYRDDRLVSTSGGCGEGPGEFSGSASLWPWPGDSLLAIDGNRLLRFTVLAPDASLGRTGTLPTNSRMPLSFVQGVLGGGSLALAGPRDVGPPPTSGVAESEVTLSVASSLEDSARVLGVYPGPTYEYSEWSGSIIRGRLAFSSSTQFAVSSERLYVGFPDRYEIHVFDATGRPLRILRRSFTPVAVDDRDIATLLDQRLADVEDADAQRSVRQAYRSLAHAQIMPAFGQPTWPGNTGQGRSMLVDELENLWVFVHYRPGEYRNDWTVFSPDGVWLGTASLPDGLTPFQIGADFVIGRWSDEEGFVHVRRHALDRQ